MKQPRSQTDWNNRLLSTHSGVTGSWTKEEALHALTRSYTHQTVCTVFITRAKERNRPHTSRLTCTEISGRTRGSWGHSLPLRREVVSGVKIATFHLRSSCTFGFQTKGPHYLVKKTCIWGPFEILLPGLFCQFGLNEFL